MTIEMGTARRVAEKDLPGERPSWWSFRIWNGMTAGTWFRFLARHGFRVSPGSAPRALGMSILSLVSSVPAFVQRRRHGAEIAAEPLPMPVFIVGHWRSGTTFLHELLATDRRFIAPTSLECFATDHFLRWGRALRRLDFMMPKRRPMDDMALGWDHPQEDEFALMAMGQRSPYEVMAFPNDRASVVEHLHVDEWPAIGRDAWAAALLTFMKRVAVGRRWAAAPNTPAPLWFLLKSPTHTARIGFLRRTFPGARFIHISRDPNRLYTSSERLWRETIRSQGLQRPQLDGGDNPLSSFILNSLPELYRNFDRDVADMPDGTLATVRYEDLVRDPEREVTRIRVELGLGEPDHPALRQHLAGVGGYRTNPHAIDPQRAAEIRARWAWYFERFGYDGPATAS